MQICKYDENYRGVTIMQENEKDNRLVKQLDFIREIDKEKEIFRQTYLADASR